MADVTMIKHKLGRLGYTFFEIGERILVDNLIVEILKSGERRYMKAIPFIIYQSHTDPSKKPFLDMKKLRERAVESGLKIETNAVLYITREILKTAGERDDLIAGISSYLEKHSSKNELRYFGMLFKNEAGMSDIWFEEYARNGNINWIDLEEFLDDFLMHKSLKENQERRTLKESVDVSSNRSMLIYLSRLFSPKQREIIQKVIEETPIDKTEYEYYIRVIKKRLEAMAELEELAETVLKKRPKRAQIDNK